MRDLTRSIKNEIALDIQAITTDTTTDGNIIAASDADKINFTVLSGAYTDGSYVVKIQHGDQSNLSDASDVADTDLLGEDIESANAPESQTTIAATNKIKKIGYAGVKAYVRLSIVSTSVTTGATLGAIVEKSTLIKPASVVA